MKNFYFIVLIGSLCFHESYSQVSNVSMQKVGPYVTRGYENHAYMLSFIVANNTNHKVEGKIIQPYGTYAGCNAQYFQRISDEIIEFVINPQSSETYDMTITLPSRQASGLCYGLGTDAILKTSIIKQEEVSNPVFTPSPTTPQILKNDYDKQIETIALELSKQFKNSEGYNVGVLDFRNNDGNVSQLCELITEDLSAELSMYSENRQKYTVIERNNLKILLEENNLVQNQDESYIARQLKLRGQLEIVITGTITVLDDYYKLTVKILETEKGDIVGRVKSTITITKRLSELHDKLVREYGTKH